jgi:hypothetical protein
MPTFHHRSVAKAPHHGLAGDETADLEGPRTARARGIVNGIGAIGSNPLYTDFENPLLGPIRDPRVIDPLPREFHIEQVAVQGDIRSERHGVAAVGKTKVRTEGARTGERNREYRHDYGPV